MISQMGGLDGLDDLYEAIILDHYHNPRNKKFIDNPDFDEEINNPFCGDELRIQAKFNDDKLEGISVSGRGCAISQASASLLAEYVEGKNVKEILNAVNIVRNMLKGEEISEKDRENIQDIDALSGVQKFPIRIKCALLGWTGFYDLINANLRSS
ncbi:MAG: SUF system NifU family Fe-S cluster assembly protein [Chloroflexi bacterium]|nr:SUF system NifU family Fe-S cluster assembly protein [Chloroflexota bacterium]